MLHALVEEWGKGEKTGKSAMIAWGSQKGLKPSEPNTRATSPAPEGSHTTTQVNTKHKTLWRQHQKAGGGDMSTEKGT